MPLRFVGLAQKFITSKKGGKGNARSVRSIGHVAWSRSVAMTKSWLAIIFLLCCLLSLSPALLWADDAVVWTNASGVSVTGNSLTKTNSTSAWDSGAASLNVIRNGYGFVEATATETNTERMIGLSNGDTDQNYPDIDFAVYLNPVATVIIYETGTSRGSFGSYAAGDRFRIEVRYGVVRYLKNGSLLYTSGVNPKYPLRVDTSLKTQGATLTNVRVGNLVWANIAGVATSADSLTKTGASGWNAGGSSTNTIESGDGFVEFTATETNTNRAAGFGSSDVDQTLSDIKFAIVLHSDATVEVSESGTSRGSFGVYAGGDRFRVECVGGTVRYYQNGSNLYTSTVTPTYPLRADSSLDTTGATITNLSLETQGLQRRRQRSNVCRYRFRDRSHAQRCRSGSRTRRPPRAIWIVQSRRPAAD